MTNKLSSKKKNPNPKTDHLKEYQFKPGQIGNPGGRPKLPEDLKKARKLNQIEVGRIINKYMNMAIGEIILDAESGTLTALEAMIGKIIVEAHKFGDYSRVNFLFDRMIGKVTDKMEIKVPKPTMVKLLDGSAILLGNEKEDEE